MNAAAYNQVDVAEREPQAAYAANALAVRNLAMACRQMDAKLVHFSTDYVFDGTANRPYTEEDRPHPLGAYAVSKLAGELYAQAFRLYQDRPDKEWGLIDCVSFVVMGARGITDALTSDEHFEQAGFKALLRKP